ncbi:hypothetical protein GCM10007877_33340 [Marinibactrum halimedae]|uniref:EF-hand domain-containing protein n=2 Tax=Marinibactrum halimedae TaxID=1444977 RepID=A0AA37T651_9GAMM|nr:hypothetical protein GCM10007877_33340 [Marinibactrum halimedae]
MASVVIASAVMTFSISPFSQAEEPSWILAKYDLNGDEQITAEEITSKKLRVFRFMDDDQDGGVSFTEYSKSDADRRQALLKARFLKLDFNHDGFITDEEYSSYLGMFASIDSDGDGSLSASEMRDLESLGEKKGEDEKYCLLWLCFRTDLD